LDSTSWRARPLLAPDARLHAAGRVRSIRGFTERFQLLAIIVLGESIVVTGAAAFDFGLNAAVVVSLAKESLTTLAVALGSLVTPLVVELSGSAAQWPCLGSWRPRSWRLLGSACVQSTPRSCTWTSRSSY
jgi:hypothetical protein